jgi:hypothetical protein
MKTGPEALGIAENESGSAKYEKGTRRTRYRRKRVRVSKTRKRDQTHSVPPKMSPGAQNIKTGTDALSTAENESGRAKHENGIRRTRHRRKLVRERNSWKRDPTPSEPPKISPGAQNMKTGPDALGASENESGRAKHENGTRRTWHRRKQIRKRKILKRDPTHSTSPKMSRGAQNMKKEPDALGTAEKESRSAKHENGIRCRRYCRK